MAIRHSTCGYKKTMIWLLRGDDLGWPRTYLWITTLTRFVFAVSPAARFALWWHTHFRPWLWDNRGFSADRQSSGPSDTLLYQLLQRNKEKISNTKSHILDLSFPPRPFICITVLQTLWWIILTLGAVGLRLLLPLFLLKLHVAIMHHSAGQLINGHFLLSCETQDIEGFLWAKRKREKS